MSAIDIAMELTPFQYAGFYDVPRYITLNYKEKHYLLQSPFDDELDDYATKYSIYRLDEAVENSSKFNINATTPCLGSIRVSDVTFDPTKRESLDASFLDRLHQLHLRTVSFALYSSLTGLPHEAQNRNPRRRRDRP